MTPKKTDTSETNDEKHSNFYENTNIKLKAIVTLFTTRFPEPNLECPISVKLKRD